ncbi:MAG: ABC transporter permease [Nocardioides sp.]|uniref:ABC transporter permease n=1 Tax=Nocardioides sp. TaxID=35761 RepID=UPI0039E5B24C
MSAVPTAERDPAVLAPTVRGRRSGRSGTMVRRLASQAFVWVLVAAAWELVCALHVVSPDLLPSLRSVAKAAPELLTESRFWDATGSTIGGAAIGFALSLAIGIPLGLFLGRAQFAERSTQLVLDFFRAFPPVAVMPVLLLLYGVTLKMKVIVVILACVWPVLIQSIYGAKSLDAAVVDTVRAYRIPRMLTFVQVVLPSATPFIVTGVRIAATTSVLVAVAVEIITSSAGLGRLIGTLQFDRQTPMAYVCIFAGGIMGYLINWLVKILEDRLLAWRPTDSGE